jgi:hypothetical protein
MKIYEGCLEIENQTSENPILWANDEDGSVLLAEGKEEIEALLVTIKKMLDTMLFGVSK